MAESLAAGIAGGTPQMAAGTAQAGTEIVENGSLGELKAEENGIVTRAREQANQATEPR